MARKRKQPVHHVQMTDGKRAIIQQLFQEYDIESAEDIQDALKDLLGGTIKEMMEAEMDDHLGYEKSQSGQKTPERHIQYRSEDHFHVCQGNDYTANFRDPHGHLRF